MVSFSASSSHSGFPDLCFLVLAKGGSKLAAATPILARMPQVESPAAETDMSGSGTYNRIIYQ